MGGGGGGGGARFGRLSAEGKKYNLWMGFDDGHAPRSMRLLSVGPIEVVMDGVGIGLCRAVAIGFQALDGALRDLGRGSSSHNFFVLVLVFSCAPSCLPEKSSRVVIAWCRFYMRFSIVGKAPLSMDNSNSSRGRGGGGETRRLTREDF